MTKNQLIKLIANLFMAVTFICAALLLINKTYGYTEIAKTTFYICGGLGLIGSAYIGVIVEKNKEFNWIFWVGSVVIFAAIAMKTLLLPNYQIVLIAGAGISGASYFFNPFSKEDDNNETDQLLDQ